VARYHDTAADAQTDVWLTGERGWWWHRPCRAAPRSRRRRPCPVGDPTLSCWPQDRRPRETAPAGRRSLPLRAVPKQGSNCTPSTWVKMSIRFGGYPSWTTTPSPSSASLGSCWPGGNVPCRIAAAMSSASCTYEGVALCRSTMDRVDV
jgi:hypothetical protein